MKTTLTWKDILADEKRKFYFTKMMNYIAAERKAGIIVYPPQKDIFNAFRFTEFSNIKIVILGQDPYYRPKQAHGLAFSVRPGIMPPPSLLNIYKELARSIPTFTIPTHGCLESCAYQGVMLLNSILTVRSGQSHSHTGIGWEIFTDKVITLINEYCEGVVFLLWGAYAQNKGMIINQKRHYVLKAPHPSPLSAYRGFFGCNHFVLANEWLIKHGQQPINWTLKLTTLIKNK